MAAVKLPKIVYRGAYGKEKKAGRWFSASKDYASGYAMGDDWGDYEGKNRPRDVGNFQSERDRLDKELQKFKEFGRLDKALSNAKGDQAIKRAAAQLDAFMDEHDYGLEQWEEHRRKYGGVRVPDSVIPHVNEYVLPKDGVFDWEGNKELQREFAEWYLKDDLETPEQIEKRILRGLRENGEIGKTLTSKQKSTLSKMVKRELKEQEEAINDVKRNIFHPKTGLPFYQEEDDVLEFLNKKKKGWNVTTFYEDDAGSDKLGRKSYHTRTDGIAKPAKVSQASAQDIAPPPVIEQVAAIAQLVDEEIYQGATWKEHIKNVFPRQNKQVMSTLNKAWTQGQNIQQMTQSLKVVLGRGGNDVKTISRSFWMHNAAQAKQSVYALSPNDVEAIVWNSTLDARTTPLICGIRDQKMYNPQTLEPIKHDIPWEGGPGAIHWNCRSSSYPKIYGVKQELTRPTVSAGKNYERGDKWNSKGKVQKNTKALREKGIIKTPVQKGGTYADWLAKQPIEMQQDILGVAGAEKFRKSNFKKITGSGGGPIKKKPKTGSFGKKKFKSEGAVHQNIVTKKDRELSNWLERENKKGNLTADQQFTRKAAARIKSGQVAKGGAFSPEDQEIFDKLVDIENKGNLSIGQKKTLAAYRQGLIDEKIIAQGGTVSAPAPKMKKPKTPSVAGAPPVDAPSPDNIYRKMDSLRKIDFTDSSHKFGIEDYPVPARSTLSFSSNAEAAKYAMKNGFAKHVDFSDFDIRATNEIMQAFDDHMRDFPKMKNTMSFIGSRKVGEVRYEAGRKALAAKHGMEYTPKDLSSLNYATAYSRGRPVWNKHYDGSGIYFTDENFVESGFDRFKRLYADAAGSYHPRGTGTLYDLTNHELGHQVEDFLSTADIRPPATRTDVLSTILSASIKHEKVSSNSYLSKYAKENEHEFVAEAWSEFRSQKSTRPTAARVGELLTMLYKEIK